LLDLIEDISVTNCSVGNIDHEATVFTQQYIVQIIPKNNHEGNIEIIIPEGAVQDNAKNDQLHILHPIF